MKSLVQRVVAAAHEQQLWQQGDTIIAACSGGPDSLALADILLQLRSTEGLRIILAHFEHGIRGAASLADAEFVSCFAKQNGMEFYCRSENVPQRAKELGLSVETAARECRYRFLRELAKEHNALLATAHHQDDQAETVLMRLLRGTGITGLAAMRPRQGNLIRPLLGIRRKDIEKYCSLRNLMPRQDETNYLPIYLRNRLRLELLPQLQQEYNPQLTEALAQLAEVAAEADEHLTREAEDWLAAQQVFSPGKICLPRYEFATLSAALQATVLRCILARLKLHEGVGFGELRKMRSLLCRGNTGTEITLPGGWKLALSYDRALLLPRAPQADRVQGPWLLQVPGVTEIPELEITVTAEFSHEMPGDLSARKIVVDAERLRPPYQVRTRQTGDSFAIPNGRKKLKDYFIDSKLPREQRERIPVFTADGEIFWLGGLRQPYVAWVNEQTEKYLCFKLKKMSGRRKNDAD